MRIVIVSDIHSNVVAIETVLAAAGSFDALWCLGDTIGYGPSPNECVVYMRQHTSVAICGNHDLACLGKVDLSDFNLDARKANLWNGKQLNEENRSWLEGLVPLRRIDNRFTIVHASPREPVWEYLLTPSQAMANFPLFDTQVCFMGHSHVQMGFRLSPAEHCERFLPVNGQLLQLDKNERYFLNPGSVGQPRDQDPRAAYVVLDTDAGTVRFNRVEYDVIKTQLQMRYFDLPPALIRRLELGM